jgi:hypothetical protein
MKRLVIAALFCLSVPQFAQQPVPEIRGARIWIPSRTH